MRVMPGQWLGVLGGGQLGRMFCQSAQAMGYRVVVLDPDPEGPASALADHHICAAYDDVVGLTELAKRCQAVTTEFENVPAASLELLSRRLRVTPGAKAVSTAQDRSAEKSFIQSQGVPVAPYADIRKVEDLQGVAETLFPGILKAARLGYDGKGQHRVANPPEAVDAFLAMGQVPCVLEARLDLARELSVVLARDEEGRCAVFPVARNVHHNGILAVTHVDGQSDELTIAASAAAKRIADGLGYHGVMCVEFFVLADGSLLVNEMAPRPHNSGHFSQNACAISQFEQQVRVMAGLPLGETRLLCPTVMLNLLGDVWLVSDSAPAVEPDWASVLALPGTSLHLYGKSEARVGRKMGHINITGPTMADVVQTANQIVDHLGLPVRATLQ